MQTHLPVDSILTISSQRVKITSDGTVTFRKRAWINALKPSGLRSGVGCPLRGPLGAGLLFWRPWQTRYLLSLCISCFCRRGIHKPEIFRSPTTGGTVGAVRAVTITLSMCSPPGPFSWSPQSLSRLWNSSNTGGTPSPSQNGFFFSLVSNLKTPDNDPSKHAYCVLGRVSRLFQVCFGSVLNSPMRGTPHFSGESEEPVEINQLASSP